MTDALRLLLLLLCHQKGTLLRRAVHRISTFQFVVLRNRDQVRAGNRARVRSSLWYCFSEERNVFVIAMFGGVFSEAVSLRDPLMRQRTVV